MPTPLTMINRHFRSDAPLWFFIGNALPPVFAIILGPLTLRKVGLERYAILGLAAYFLALVASYSDFSASTHLLAAQARRAPGRHADFANALALRFGIILLSFIILGFLTQLAPRNDTLYALLAISLAGVILPSVNIEWYFIAERYYRQMFVIRSISTVFQAVLLLTWFFSSSNNVLFVPAIVLAGSVIASGMQLRFLGTGRILRGFSYLSMMSWTGIRRLILRLLPMAGVLFIAPYFLAYALPWYSMVCSDKERLGAFSIGYRLAIGFSTLMVPAVLYFVSRAGAAYRRPSFPRVLAGSALLCTGSWILGACVVWGYFIISKVSPELFPGALGVFSILMIGLFSLCLRAPYVARTIAGERYRTYFVVHLVACAPVLIFSLISRRWIANEAVPWLACLPDVIATTIFVIMSGKWPSTESESPAA